MTPGSPAAAETSCTALIANASNTVSVIDATNNTVTTTITVGTNPSAVAVSPDGATAYITNFNDNTVSVIDTTTNTVTATIPVESGPEDVAFGPCATPEPEIEAEVTGDGRSVSVTGSGFPANTTIAVSLEDLTLGTATTDADGTFTGEFSVTDCDLTGGTLTATAGDSSATSDVTLTPCQVTTTTTTTADPTTTTTSATTTPSNPATPGELPVTGAAVLPLLATGVLLLASGGGLAAITARRRRSADDEQA